MVVYVVSILYGARKCLNDNMASLNGIPDLLESNQNEKAGTIVFKGVSARLSAFPFRTGRMLLVHVTTRPYIIEPDLKSLCIRLSVPSRTLPYSTWYAA